MRKCQKSKKIVEDRRSNKKKYKLKTLPRKNKNRYKKVVNLSYSG
jgi:hypothetical protein